MSKPKKETRVMCPDCGRAKMLFETEKKALDFLKWNGKDIYVPEGRELRPYYCPSCCGYHITSKPHKASYDDRTTHLLEAYHRDARTAKKIMPFSIGSLATTIFENMPINTKMFKKRSKVFTDEYLEMHNKNVTELEKAEIFKLVKEKCEEFTEKEVKRASTDAIDFMNTLSMEVKTDKVELKNAINSYLEERQYDQQTPYSERFRGECKKLHFKAMYDNFHMRYDG